MEWMVKGKDSNLCLVEEEDWDFWSVEKGFFESLPLVCDLVLYMIPVLLAHLEVEYTTQYTLSSHLLISKQYSYYFPVWKHLVIQILMLAILCNDQV